MGAGTASIGTFQKQEPSGAPFPAGSANNGLSVDPVTGEIVLGNDDPGILATLLSNREIPFGGFNVSFSNIGADLFADIRANNGFRVHDAAFDLDTVLGKGFVQIRDNIGGGASVELLSPIGNIALHKVANTQVFVIDDTTGPPSLALLSLDFTNNVSQFGDSNIIGNGNRLRIDDGLGQYSMGINGVASFLFLDNQVNLYEIGDVSGVTNGTFLAIDDAAQSFNLKNTTMGLALVNPQAGLLRIATPGISTLLQLLDSSGANGIQINSTGVIGTLSGAPVTIAGQGFTTADPGSGLGTWLVGSVVAAVSVLDATRYVEVKINNAVVKLGVIV